MVFESLFRLGFEAPVNYNLSDFYIQTLAIAAHDREASLERVEVSLNKTIDIFSFPSFYQHICDKYENSPLYAQYIDEVQQYHEIDDDQSGGAKGIFNRSSKFVLERKETRSCSLKNSSLDIKQDFLLKFDGYCGDHRLIHFAIHSNFDYVLFSVLSSVFLLVSSFSDSSTINNHFKIYLQ